MLLIASSVDLRMSAFANSNFPATLYSLTRPTYPCRLFEYVFNYHERKHAAEWDRALDIGCGTGMHASIAQSHSLTEHRAGNYRIDPISRGHWT